MDLNQLLELFATLFGIAYVLLAVFEKRSAWLFGIASSGLAIYLLLISKLYSESLLYSYYVLAGIYAWIYWGKDRSTAAIVFIRKGQILFFFLLGILGSFALGNFFSQTDAAFPYFDAITTVFSFIATWLTARKVLENWLLWIAVDIASIVLYGLKGLYMLSGLMLVYTIVAIFGYIQWKRKLSESQL